MTTDISLSPIPKFVALGNGVWLDEIRVGLKPPIRNVPGGSVTFATIGARMFMPDNTDSIAMIFNAGQDFPDDTVQMFESWSINLKIHRIIDKPSARGLVFYEESNFNRKGFQRLTEPLPVTIKDLEGTSLLLAKAFHFFGTAEYIIEQLHDLEHLRGLCPGTSTIGSPFIIWEPHAKSCRPDTLQKHLDAAKLVDVFSPNHEELNGFFNNASSHKFDKHGVEAQAQVFSVSGIGPSGDGCMLVRCAGDGCFVSSRASGHVWLAPVYLQCASSIVDPTGAGNSFLGAFAIGWQETQDYVIAAMYGHVAASFAIEQCGLPVRSGAGAEEKWNGCNVRHRLEIYRKNRGS